MITARWLRLHAGPREGAGWAYIHPMRRIRVWLWPLFAVELSLSRSARAIGLLDTAEGSEYRWRDLTPLFWRTLGRRVREARRRMEELRADNVRLRERLACAEADAAAWRRLEAAIAERERAARQAARN